MMRQARSEIRKQAKIKRHEKAVELQIALEDRAAARSVQRELAELHRSSIRWAARFKVRAEPNKPETQTSPVTKRIIGTAIRASSRTDDVLRPASSWVVDDLGMKGVIWQQSYLGRKSPAFHPGAARENWEYIVRDEAVLLDAEGEALVISNMGEDWVEIGAGWQAMEDASTRANAKIQIIAVAPFDSDMSKAEMIAALTHFCKMVLEPLDLPYSAAIHAPPAQGDQRNFHPHLAFSLRSMRRVEPYCWEVADDVCGELDGRDGVQMLRHLWAHSMSVAAEEARSNRRYTGLGYGARRLDLKPGEHLGEARAAIVARGVHVWANERNRIKTARNAARRTIQDADHKIAALTKIRDAAIRRIELRIDNVVAAKVLRIMPPVAVAKVQTHPDLPTAAATLNHTDDQASARALTASSPTAEATTVNAARAPTPSRQTLATITVPVEPVVLTASKAATPAIACVTSGSKAQPMAVRNASRPIVPVVRLKTSQPITPAAGYQAAIPSIEARVREPLPIGHVASANALPTSAVTPPVSRVLSPALRVRPSADRAAAAPRASTTASDHTDDLSDLLRIARLARLRRRRNTAVAGELRLDMLPVLGDLPSLDALSSLETLAFAKAVHESTSVDRLGDDNQRRVTRLVSIDPYIADYGGEGGQVETDYPALKAIGAGWDWLKIPGVQAALRAARDEQQQVMVALTVEATMRPLAFTTTGSRFWPRDLPAHHLRRLDRWASDPGFQHDVFQMQQAIGRAHVERDAERRKQTPTDRGSGTVASVSTPDGFGGWRQGPVPVYHDEGIYARIAAFDSAIGRPTDQLLMLLMLSGQHPRQIAFASDGLLMALPGKPTMLGALLHPWRHDDRVVALVSDTVRASRNAASPVWPRNIAAAVQAYAARSANTPASSTVRPAPDLGRGPTR